MIIDISVGDVEDPDHGRRYDAGEVGKEEQVRRVMASERYIPENATKVGWHINRGAEQRATSLPRASSSSIFRPDIVDEAIRQC
jgi:hypothetical protein